MNYRTPMARVMGLGAAKDGVEHWWGQRVTAVALVALTPLALFPLGAAIGAGLEAVKATYAHPFNAIVMILFLTVTFRHLQYGLQVVIEDYVHHKPARTALMLGNTGFCAAVGLAGIFGVAKLAFGA